MLLRIVILIVGLTMGSVAAFDWAEPIPVLKISARLSNEEGAQTREVSILKADDAILYRFPLMNIDLDGAPNAYHPPTPAYPHGKGPGLGLDDLRNASATLSDGPDARWVGVVADADGQPIVQRSGPYTGFYVSTTTLEDSHFPLDDPRRYVDATKVPYVVLNPILRKKAGLDVGDLAAVVLNQEDPKVAFGIVADVGPVRGLGECSKKLADLLAKPHGVEGGNLVYIFFPTPQKRKVRRVEEIQAETASLFNAWGGIERVQSLK